jgi:adenylate cyclase
MVEQNEQRRLAAILAADMVGYSRLVETDERGTIARQLAHRNELIDPKITEHHGRIVKTTGDGIIVEFASVVDAVECAVVIQREMAVREDDVTDDRRIQYRIGVNLGDVIDQDSDLLGAGVNVAARLEGLAAPGGICISRAARDQVRDLMDILLEDMGEVEVKNIKRPVRVFRVLQDGEKPKAQHFLHNSGRKKALIAVLVVLTVVFAGFGAWITLPSYRLISDEKPPSHSNPQLSIAVLPFTNMSGEKDQDYIADALTEDLTADLSRISGSFVISRSTAATYRGRNIDSKRVADELKIRYLLEGTVRKSRSEVRVNVRLIDGKTGQQVWSERYEKTADDMYAFQNEVTGQIARALNLELKDALSRQAARNNTGNLEASDFTLRAWADLWTKPQSPGTNKSALAHVARALAIDPDNAEALGVAAYAYARAATYGWGMSRAEAIQKGVSAGEKSIALDSKNADAVYSLGFLYYLAGDTQKSLELMRQCIDLNRNHAPAYFFSGINLIRLGRPGDAILWVERAFALSPRDPLRSVWYGTIARAQILIGDDALAIETAQKGVAANPKHSQNYAALASAYALLGKMKKANAALQDFQRVRPGITLSGYRRQVASDDPVALKTYERLLSGLSKAGLNN